MSTEVQRRRGNTIQHATFTGLVGELSVNTSNNSLVIHNGATAGGYEVMRRDLTNADNNSVANTLIAANSLTNNEIAANTIIATNLGLINLGSIV